MENYKALIVRPDGTVEVRAVEQSVSQMQSLVGGGYVEAVTLDAATMMLIDEDGRSKGLTSNVQATLLGERVMCAPFESPLLGQVAFVGTDGSEEFSDVADWIVQAATRPTAV